MQHLYLSTPLSVQTNELNKEDDDDDDEVVDDDDDDQSCDSEEPNRMYHGNWTEMQFLHRAAQMRG